MNRNINNNNVTSLPEHTYVTIQSNASASFGGYCNFDINFSSYCIHEITMEFAKLYSFVTLRNALPNCYTGLLQNL